MNSQTPWPNAEWFDDWYAVERIDDKTFAIGEPRYWQFVVSFLILGEERALLFDSGSARREMRPVVESLTALPVTVACSHLHFDHVGNHRAFERVAMFDHPTLRQRVRDGIFTPTYSQYLKLDRPRFNVTEWWSAGHVVDLGGRQLEVIHVPGHAVESIALLDRGHGQLFLGDFLYNAELFVEDTVQYLHSTERLVSCTGSAEVLWGAHGRPRMPYARLEELAALLRGIEEGTVRPRFSLAGLTPQRRVVSGNIDLRLPLFGVRGILLPYLVAALLAVVLALVIALTVSWLAGASILIGGGVVASMLHSRM